MTAEPREHAKADQRALALTRQRKTDHLKIKRLSRHLQPHSRMSVQPAQEAIRTSALALSRLGRASASLRRLRCYLVPGTTGVMSKTLKDITRQPEARQDGQDRIATVAWSPEKAGTPGDVSLWALQADHRREKIEMGHRAAARPIKLKPSHPGVQGATALWRAQDMQQEMPAPAPQEQGMPHLGGIPTVPSRYCVNVSDTGPLDPAHRAWNIRGAMTLEAMKAA